LHWNPASGEFDSDVVADVDAVVNLLRAMGLRYANVTGVALFDGGAWLYAVTVRAIKRLNPSTGVQQLIPYSNGGPSRLPMSSSRARKFWARNVETAGSQGKLQARAILGEVAWPKPWTEATHR